MKTELGPDATGVGWVFQYALVDDSNTHSLSDLRTFQDWNLRYRLQSVPGVAEVASIGGFVQQYQVTVDPNRLKSYDLAIMDVAAAVRASNNEVGGRLLEFAGKEFMVRGRGYVRSKEDLEKVVLKTDEKGTPVLMRDVGDGRARARDAPGCLGPRRDGRHRGRHRRDAPRRERARGHRARARAPEGGRAVASQGRPHRDDLRPLGA